MRKPNLLFIFSDQHRACDLGCYGNREIISPRLDEFANGALRFTNCIASAPLCVPARGSLITGLFPWKHRAITNDLPIRTDVMSIASICNENGYHSGYIGKWHLAGVPRTKYIDVHERLGFTEWKAYRCNHRYFKGYYFDEQNTRHIMGAHESIVETDLAIDFIERNSGKQWVLVLSWEPPHSPYLEVPGKYLAQYEEKKITLRPNVSNITLPQGLLHRHQCSLLGRGADPGYSHGTTEVFTKVEIRKRLAGYYALISLLDEQFGRIINTLERTRQRENTVVIYTSDHGDMHGSHGFIDKQLPYLESICVPLFVSWLGKTRIGTTDEIIGLADLPVSLLGLMGIVWPRKTDGKDMNDLFTDKNAKGLDACLIFNLVPVHSAYHRGINEWMGIKTKQYTYVRDAHGNGYLLYNDIMDPYQQHNLIHERSMRPIEETLKTQFDTLLKEHNYHFRPWEDMIRQDGFIEEWNKSQAYFKLPLLS